MIKSKNLLKDNFSILAILEMMSVAPGEIVLRGESANRYIGMDNNGNLIGYVSNQLAPVAYPLDKSLSSG